ncbi:two-component system response regulator [Salinicola sp. MH3R3-1]|uniref:response regulator n=1 Tax=Salinicola TaxID=404432 RepID=UPI00094E28A5|nr:MULTISPECIES: response regulator [Salinicola]OLO07750.1 two-component system response regulator [Salinicola sp. MH3R3-1]
MRVLVVEDDPMVMRLNVEFLNRLDGVSLVAQCEDLPAAREILAQEPVDLLLLDVYLREHNGLSLVRDLRRQARDIQIVLITAASEMETVREAKHLGVSDYLVKPFEFERFKEALARCLDTHQRLSRLPARAHQRDLDALFRETTPGQPARPGDLPKGLTSNSLSQVAKAAADQGTSPFTTEAMSENTGMSRVSVRKYLKHLVDRGVLEESFHYGQIGRPSFTYRCLDDDALARLGEPGTPS